jgi:hypothetical protein
VFCSQTFSYSKGGPEADLVSLLIKAFGHWSLADNVWSVVLSNQNCVDQPVLLTPSSGNWGHVEWRCTPEDHQGSFQVQVFVTILIIELAEDCILLLRSLCTLAPTGSRTLVCFISRPYHSSKSELKKVLEILLGSCFWASRSSFVISS